MSRSTRGIINERTNEWRGWGARYAKNKRYHYANNFSNCSSSSREVFTAMRRVATNVVPTENTQQYLLQPRSEDNNEETLSAAKQRRSVLLQIIRPKPRASEKEASPLRRLQCRCTRLLMVFVEDHFYAAFVFRNGLLRGTEKPVQDVVRLYNEFSCN